MAIYRFCMKAGKNAVSHLNYIQRENKYSKRKDLYITDFFNLPKQFDNINDFWISAERYERKNANMYREFEIALPKEFNDEYNKKILDKFLNNIFDEKYVYNYAIHNKNNEQPHAHVMFCDRVLDGIEREKDKFFKRYNSKFPEKGGARKDEIIKKEDTLFKFRKEWEKHLNLFLEANGVEPVSCEKLEVQKSLELSKGNIEKAILLDREPLNLKTLNFHKIDSEENEIYQIYNERKKIENEIFLKQKKNNFEKKYNSQKDKYKNFSVINLMEEQIKIDINISKLINKMKDNRLENIALNDLSNGRFNKIQNEIKQYNKKIKTNSSKKIYEEKIKSCNDEIKKIKDENIKKIENKKLEIKKKYTKALNYLMEEKKIIEKIIFEESKKIKKTNLEYEEILNMKKIENEILNKGKYQKVILRNKKNKLKKQKNKTEKLKKQKMRNLKLIENIFRNISNQEQIPKILPYINLNDYFEEKKENDFKFFEL